MSHGLLAGRPVLGHWPRAIRLRGIRLKTCWIPFLRRQNKELSCDKISKMG